MLIFALGLLKQTAEGKGKMMFLGLDYWMVECIIIVKRGSFTILGRAG